MFGVDALMDVIKGYIDARIQLFKLELQEKAATVFTVIAIGVMLAFTFFMTIIFLSIAVGGFLNSLLNSMFWGYLIVAGFYLFFAIILAININSGFLNRKIHRMASSVFNPKKNK